MFTLYIHQNRISSIADEGRRYPVFIVYYLTKINRHPPSRQGSRMVAEGMPAGTKRCWIVRKHRQRMRRMPVLRNKYGPTDPSWQPIPQKLCYSIRCPSTCMRRHQQTHHANARPTMACPIANCISWVCQTDLGCFFMQIFAEAPSPRGTRREGGSRNLGSRGCIPWPPEACF
jgi:hypothetical protein